MRTMSDLLAAGLTGGLLSCGGAGLGRPAPPPPRPQGQDCAPISEGKVIDLGRWSLARREGLSERIGTGVTLVAKADTCGVILLEDCAIAGGYFYHLASEGDSLVEQGERADAEMRASGDPLVTGRYDLRTLASLGEPLQGRCEGATHVITGIGVGAADGQGSARCSESSSDAPSPGCDVLREMQIAPIIEEDGDTSGNRYGTSGGSTPPPPSPPPSPRSCNPDDPICSP